MTPIADSYGVGAGPKGYVGLGISTKIAFRISMRCRVWGNYRIG